ncbi:flavohemoprotein [Arthrobacter liuii]|uniref:nitric oxide dioxygenase n=2 Tax=Arthrobacter liuii TaxID=1476996 RepID=A0ABQ2AUS1_9MICC|nr:flavohemoprotein [Arthrobacter liuii]
MDAGALKRTWSMAAACGDEVPLYFYSHLFVSHPELREMFPVSMAGQRDKLFAALGHIVSHADQIDQVGGFIGQLGRDHRRFSVEPEQYSMVGASFLATLQKYLGPEWTDDVAQTWAEAYGLIAKVMVVAAEEASDTTPPWWEGEVTAVERRSLDITVLEVRTAGGFEYSPGQSAAVEVPSLPRTWRYLSPANAPRPDGTIELHVQLIPGGLFSTAAVRRTKVGDTVRIGAPVGDQLTLQGQRDLLMVAGGTGLAPMASLVDEVRQQWSEHGDGPRVDLYHGARVPWNLYDQQRLTELASTEPWFRYHPVVSDDATFPGAKGYVGSVAAAHPEASRRLALVAGSTAMVGHTISELVAAGTPRSDIRYEDYAGVEDNSSATGEDQEEEYHEHR